MTQNVIGKMPEIQRKTQQRTLITVILKTSFASGTPWLLWYPLCLLTQPLHLTVWKSPWSVNSKSTVLHICFCFGIWLSYEVYFSDKQSVSGKFVKCFLVVCLLAMFYFSASRDMQSLWPCDLTSYAFMLFCLCCWVAQGNALGFGPCKHNP